MRFISIILEPSRHWSDHGVVDVYRRILICKCSESRDADQIAACMNLQYQEREAKQLAAAALEGKT